MISSSKGITQSGQQFRLSDWSDRLCGVMSAFGPDEQLRYSPLVTPALRDGLRCVVCAASLRSWSRDCSVLPEFCARQ